MRAVDVGVGHQDDAVVAQLVRVVLVAADAGTERGDQRADLVGGQHAVEAGAFHVEDLAAQRQHRLVLAVAALLGRATCRVTLDDEQFRQCRILFLAVGQLAGQACDVQRTLAAGEVARLARRFARTRGIDDLAGDGLGFVRVLLQELLQARTEGVFHRRAHIRTDQLFLGLRREAGVGHLDRKHRDHAFAHVVAGQRDLGLLGDAVLFDVGAEHARQRRTEAGQVGAAVLLRDVVGEAVHGFLVGVGPLQGHVHHDAVVLAGHRDHIRVQRRLQLRQMLHEAADAAFVMEIVATAFAALVDQGDLDARIEEGQLAQAPRQDVVMELDVAEDGHGRLEAQRGTALGRGFQLLERVLRLAQRVFLLVVEAVAPDIQPQVL